MKSAPSRPWSKKLQINTTYRVLGQIASNFEPRAQNGLKIHFLQSTDDETLFRVH